ncbi:hypothetical protein AAC387_Pa11g1869 [Persea americana]
MQSLLSKEPDDWLSSRVSVLQMDQSSSSRDATDPCGSRMLLSLPDDVLSILSAFLHPRDLCNLSLCCRSLRSLALSDKLWVVQCSITGLLPPRDLTKWRSSLSSYRALCRFLHSALPLLGIWVHQNPELGNVVFVMLGFLSVVACRIIPQELGPSGIDASPLLWAPVFEIAAESDGSMAFFLHGRENNSDYLYPGFLKSIHPNCNLLLLEVGPRPAAYGGKLLHTKSTIERRNSDSDLPSRSICRSDSSISRLPAAVPFSRLAFGDRRRLLELVANQVRLRVPDSFNCRPFLPQSREGGDLGLLRERRAVLIQMHKVSGGAVNWLLIPGLRSNGSQMESGKMKKVLDRPASFNSNCNEDHRPATTAKSKTVAGIFKDGIKQILGRSNSVNGTRIFSKNGTSSSRESKHVPLPEFLRASDTIGLSVCAMNVKLYCYRAWPNMHDNRYALYKLPLRSPAAGQEYAGLWGGSFGWPPGRPAEDKPGTALFFLLISYEECDGQRTLIATKILEGTHYVLHPNGSAMFIVKVDEPSLEPFPWDTDGNSVRIEIKNAYNGEGIANGYGFRYPGSKPGSLFVTQNGLLAFVWKESRAVLTLQRLNLQELLKKGERVPALPPIANFSYLTKSYSNVFTSFSIASSSLPSPR